MYEIVLKGEISSKEIDGKDVINLSTLQPSLIEADGQDLQIKINTNGGCVDTAFLMYDALNEYREKHKANITTITDENCASSGVILLLAGNERIVNKNSIPFVHEVYAKIEGGANDLINAGFEVEDCNWKIATLYSQRTNLTYDEARWFMSEERNLTPDECFTFGFATKRSEIYNQRVDKKNLLKKLNYKKNVMANENVVKTILKEFAELKNLFKGVKMNKKEMTSADVELDFPEVGSDSNPVVGDKATVDGNKASGEYLMKSGKTYIFKDGILDEIKEAEDNEDEEKKNLKIEVQNLKNQLTEKETVIKDLSEKLESETLKVEKFNSLQSKIESYVKNEKKTTDKEKESKDEDFDFKGSSERLRKMKD